MNYRKVWACPFFTPRSYSKKVTCRNLAIIPALALALALSGCAQFDAAKGVAVNEATKVADEARDSAEFMLCRGMTVGAWVRAYGSSTDKANAWKVLCATGNSQTPAKQ